MAGYTEYYKISYTSGERVLTVCDNPKLMPVLMLKKRKQTFKFTGSNALDESTVNPFDTLKLS